MKTLDRTFAIGGLSFRYDKPNVCPYCGLTIDATEEPRPCAHNVYIVFFKCTNTDCVKQFWGVYKYTNKNNRLDFLYTYPDAHAPGISQRIKDLSPRFAELYTHSVLAENRGHRGLAACGYRNAIEALIKDYAAKYENAKLKDLRSETVAECIRKYLRGLEEVVIAYIVKEFANNSTHYPPDDDMCSYEDFKKCLDILLIQMDAKIMLKEFSPSLPPKLATKIEGNHIPQEGSHQGSSAVPTA